MFPGRPNITGDTDGNNGQIAAVDFPSSIFNSPQVTQDQASLTVAVAVYEESAFFPLRDKDSGPDEDKTIVGTPVVSLLVARDRQQLKIDDLNPPIVLNLSVTQISAEVMMTTVVNSKINNASFAVVLSRM